MGLLYFKKCQTSYPPSVKCTVNTSRNYKVSAQSYMVVNLDIISQNLSTDSKRSECLFFKSLYSNMGKLQTMTDQTGKTTWYASSASNDSHLQDYKSYTQGQPLGEVSGVLVPGTDFKGAPKRRSPTWHTLPLCRP
jgi:hypothetical protein